MIKFLLKVIAFLTVFAAGIFSAKRQENPSAQVQEQSPLTTAPAVKDEAAQPASAGLKRWAWSFVVFFLALVIGGFLVAASGVIPIKASSGHWGITRWFLQFSKSRSVATHTLGMKVPPLDDPLLVLKGAGHFETGCSPCHGSPQRVQPRVAEHMLPRPPNLKFAITEWAPEELFHIVKHGIKLTGMPAWPALQRDDEVWAMVAFLQKLPDLNANEYRRLASGETFLTEGAPIQDLQIPKGVPRVITQSCARCHGVDGLGRGLGAFPKLAGQKREYLLASLEAYARGERYSGFMEPIAAGLSPETMEEISTFYNNQPQKSGEPAQEDQSAAIERGKSISLRGLPQQGVPACFQCHGPEPPRNPIYPLLGGQYPDYLVLQLELFKKGQRGGTPYSHLMQHVASRLTPEQMRDVALYWGSLTNHHVEPRSAERK